MDARTEDGTTALMLASRLAVEDLVEELIAAQADVGARDKRGMDLERLMCHREVEQIGYEIKCKKKKKREQQRSNCKLGDSLPSRLAVRVVNL